MLTEKDFITDTEASIEMMPNSGTDMVANYKGEIRTETQGNKHDDAYGTLAGGTKITFTYTLTPALTKPGNVDNFFISGDAHVEGLYEIEAYQESDATFIISFANFTNAVKKFAAALQLPGYKGDVTTTYLTEAVSAVPLPAALPLFGLGIAGLAGLKRMRKRSA